MAYTLATILVITIFIRMLYWNKKSAQKACVELESRINNNKQYFDNLVREIADEKKYNRKNPIFNENIDLFLISKKNGSLQVDSLNNQRVQTMLLPQYERILKKFHSGENITFTYSLQSFSIFIKLDQPYENRVLRIDYY